MRHSPGYLRYLKSPAWKRTRAQALVRANYQCAACGARRSLEVHHLHYRSLGRESPLDLIVLCATCHEIADELRRRGRAERP